MCGCGIRTDNLLCAATPWGHVASIEEWFASGTRVAAPVHLGLSPHLSVHITGDSGPWTTFLHGYPTCSWDWAPVLGRLPPGRRRLTLDLLGFGDSDKPREVYSLFDQLALVRQVWDDNDVEETTLVAHDYSVSIAQEIVAQMVDGTWDGPRIPRIILLNGGLFYSIQTPLLIQRLLRHPWAGPLATRLITRPTFNRSFRRVFAPGHRPSPSDLASHWRGIERHGGRTIQHLLSRYHEERAENEERWTRALARSPVPLTLVWGMRDPVSGAPMVAHAREAGIRFDAVTLDDVGHYPQLEVPGTVAGILARLEAEGARDMVEPVS